MIVFTTKDHCYTHRASKEKYTSVTTLISQYKNKFDMDFWSRYKALEKILPEFVILLRKFGRSIKMLEHKLYTNYPELIEKYDKEVISIQETWKGVSKKALEKGTKHHSEKEEELYLKGTGRIDTTFGIVELPVVDIREITRGETYSNSSICNNLYDLEDGIYPELLLWNDKYKIAGQSDEISIVTIPLTGARHVIINDHKTNAVIKKESYKDPKPGGDYKRMLFPVDNLMDCDLYHYTLQLSIYGWMLEQFGFKVDVLSIKHYEELMYVDYIREDVTRLLKHYSLNK